MTYESWKIPKPVTCADAPAALLGSGCPPLLALLLRARGFTDPAQAEQFLSGSGSGLHDPMLLADVEKAVSRIRLAVSRNERVAVYGDYDVDGITSSCLMADALVSLGLECELYIPDRIEEGYGLNSAAISLLHGKGVSLIVTVDCGITAIDETLEAKALGVDMIITDHHECRPVLPEAVAVINPKRPDCGYPETGLAGVGVAFKLACALCGDSAAALEKYAQLVAVGTVADVMPMTGENRLLIREGLKQLNDSPSPGLLALMREAGIEGRRLTAMTVGFTIAPRLNAAGRLGRSDIAARLLCGSDRADCESLARLLCGLNRDRQAIELGIWEQAVSMLEGRAPDEPIVLASEGWHQGVVGIAASRLTEAYSVPAIMICLDGETGKGSCRSFGGFNLFDALSDCEHLLEGFGGHAQAAGLSIRRENIEPFRKAFAEYYRRHRPLTGPELEIDLNIGDVELLDMPGVTSLDRLEPCGSGNPKPVMCITGAALESVTPIGGNKHVKLQAGKHGRSFECVFFNHTAAELGLSVGDRVDLAFWPQINEFRGRSTVQLHLTSLRPAAELELCRRILEGESLTSGEAAEMLPVREDFVAVWRQLLATDGGKISSDMPRALEQLRQPSPAKTAVCLSVLEDSGLVELQLSGGNLSIRSKKTADKVDLDASPKLRALRLLAAGAE